MKKIFLILCFLFLFGGINTSFSAWYGNHAVSYNTSSSTIECDSDLDYTGGKGDTFHDKDRAVTDISSSLTPTPSINTYSLNSDDTNATPVPETGTMRCLYWDGANPIISDTYAYDGTWINSGSVLIYFNIIERGGSGVKEIKWCDTYNCDPSTGSVTSNPLSISADFNKTIRYQVWDNAGNASSIGSVVVKIKKPLIDHEGTESLEGIKIIGKVHDTNVTFINDDQNPNTMGILGNLTKASLERDIRSKAYSIIKSINHNSTASLSFIDNLTGTSWTSNNGGKLLNNQIIYYNLTGFEAGKNIVLNGTSVGGNKTIIVKGGNLYIKSNMSYSSSNSTLGIIVLKDDNGDGGNVYIDPSVTHIVGSMYADKSILSYNGTELSGNATQSALKNQLYIYGQVFAENTIGGAVSPYKCPYYITTTCNQDIARKYDLNFLRLYSVYDSNGDGTLDSVTNGGNYYFDNSSIYFKHPLIIKYNPQVQLTPPPLFTK